MVNESHDDPLESSSVVVVDSKYVSAETRYFVARRTSKCSATGNFNIIDHETKKVVFEIVSQAKTIYDRKVVNDQTGNAIVTLSQKFPSLHQRWQCHKGGIKINANAKPEDLLFTAKYPSFKNNFTSNRIHIDVFLAGSSKKGVCDFKIGGDLVGVADTCSVFLKNTDEIIAQISKSMCFAEDMYKLKVWPNIDYSFIVALCVALDEITYGLGV